MMEYFWYVAAALLAGVGTCLLYTSVVPEMQIKLKQGFGRAIRTETDTCVVAILDDRATPGCCYFGAAKTALPDMRQTSSTSMVARFIRSVKHSSYFREGRS